VQIVGIIVTGFISLLIGVLGFPQIIGCIKYFYLRKPAKNFGTIFVWVIVLGIVGIIAHVFFIDYIAGYYAGTVIAFIRSFSVKPDENLISPPQEKAEDVFVSSIQIPDDAPDELKELYRKQQIAEKGIWTARKTITQLHDDLDASPSEEQMKSAYESGLVTKEKYNEYLKLRQSVNLHIQAQKNVITMVVYNGRGQCGFRKCPRQRTRYNHLGRYNFSCTRFRRPYTSQSTRYYCYC